jgi:hypothetical protein
MGLKILMVLYLFQNEMLLDVVLTIFKGDFKNDFFNSV